VLKSSATHEFKIALSQIEGEAIQIKEIELGINFTSKSKGPHSVYVNGDNLIQEKLTLIDDSVPPSRLPIVLEHFTGA
jgi:hypothetical protein